MPQTYERRLNTMLGDNLYELVVELEQTPQSQWETLLTTFVFENGASIQIMSVGDGAGSQTFLGTSYLTIFSDIHSHSGIFTTTSISVAISFWHNGTEFIITTIGDAAIRAVIQMTGIFAEVFPYVLLLVLLTAVLAAFLYSRFLAKPIVQISGISKKIANLELTERCDTSRSDEIGILANNLNDMAEKLSASMGELQSANEQLQADIEKEREDERRRRDFFVAISHELKTPVTILKGELDGMILNVGKFKDRDKYLQEAYKTSESIEKLVQEIMTLAKLDTIRLQREDVDLSQITDECVGAYESMAQSKDMQINRRYDADAIIQGDKTQIQTVLSNIIGNAVKHSPEHSLIDVYIAKEESTVRLSVENSGVHIAPDELSKIWEPFYRTDKSRSRDTGGSGLGLYIVKTILDLHGFAYQLTPTEAGMKFTVIF